MTDPAPNCPACRHGADALRLLREYDRMGDSEGLEAWQARVAALVGEADRD